MNVFQVVFGVNTYISRIIWDSTQSKSTTTTLELEGSFMGFGDHVVTELFLRGETTPLPHIYDGMVPDFQQGHLPMKKNKQMPYFQVCIELDSIIDNSTLINWLFACRYVRHANSQWVWLLLGPSSSTMGKIMLAKFGLCTSCCILSFQLSS